MAPSEDVVDDEDECEADDEDEEENEDEDEDDVEGGWPEEDAPSEAVSVTLRVTL